MLSPHSLVAPPPLPTQPDQRLFSQVFASLASNNTTASGESQQTVLLQQKTLVQLTRAISQLSDLSQAAYQVYEELGTKTQETTARIDAIEKRIQTIHNHLKENPDLLSNLALNASESPPPRTSTGSSSSSAKHHHHHHHHNKLSGTQRSSTSSTTPLQTSNLFTKASEHPSFRAAYDACTKVADLKSLDKFRTDGQTCLKFYSHPEYFVEEWRQVMQKEHDMKRARRQARKKTLATGGAGGVGVPASNGGGGTIVSESGKIIRELKAPLAADLTVKRYNSHGELLPPLPQSERPVTMTSATNSPTRKVSAQITETLAAVSPERMEDVPKSALSTAISSDKNAGQDNQHKVDGEDEEEEDVWARQLGGVKVNLVHHGPAATNVPPPPPPLLAPPAQQSSLQHQQQQTVFAGGPFSPSSSPVTVVTVITPATNNTAAAAAAAAAAPQPSTLAAPPPPPPPPPPPTTALVSSSASVPQQTMTSASPVPGTTKNGPILPPKTGPPAALTGKIALLSEIRGGQFKLRRVSTAVSYAQAGAGGDANKRVLNGPSNNNRSNLGKNEIAALLMRRAALEMSDSEDGSSDEESEAGSDWD